MPISEGPVHYLGKLTEASDISIPITNRAFRYGDAIFETIRLSRSKPLFYTHHYSRFILGLDAFQFEIPEEWSLQYIRDAILELAEARGLENARIRMSAFRMGHGLYTPTDNGPGLLIEASPLEQPFFQLNQKGLSLGTFEKHKIAPGPLSEVKSANAAPYVLAAIAREKSDFDELIILNTAGRIAEASSSNLFVFGDGKLKTPSLDEGCISGIMRRVLIKIAKREGIPIEEVPLELEELNSAEEVFVTNAIAGIRWISTFGEKAYGNKFISGLFGKLEERVLSEISRK